MIVLAAVPFHEVKWAQGSTGGVGRPNWQKASTGGDAQRLPEVPRAGGGIVQIGFIRLDPIKKSLAGSDLTYLV